MNKGFTLIELIAVIIILALIMLIVVPSINDDITNSKINLNREQIKQIENAARQWGLEHLIVDNNNEPSPHYVTIDQLKQSGYLNDEEVFDIKSNEPISQDAKICIFYNKQQFVYDFNGNC